MGQAAYRMIVDEHKFDVSLAGETKISCSLTSDTPPPTMILSVYADYGSTTAAFPPLTTVGANQSSQAQADGPEMSLIFLSARVLL